MRPMVQLNDYLNQSQSQGAPWWLYFRNAWAYGVAALLLLVPGIAIAWRRSTTHRAIAMAWVIALIAMQCVAMKEVRYLVFLTPLSAILIAPAIQWLGTPGRRWMLTLPAVALCVDLMHVAPEAALIKSPFYRQSECRQLLSPLEMAGGKRKPVLASYRYLSFATPEHSPFVGDRYHRIFHFEIDHIQALYGYKKGEVILFDPKKVPLIVNDFRDNTPLLFANHLLLNSLGWEHRAPLGKDTFFQCIAFARTITLTRDARGALVTPEGVSLELYPGTVDERPAMMFGSPLQRELGRLVMPVMVDVDTNQAWPIRRVSKGTYAVTPGSETDLNKSRQITIRGFEIAFYIQYK